MKVLLKNNGTITLEFPHIMRLIQYSQFDTVYHEHFSYLSLHTVIHIFNSFGLRIYHVEELSTHGGSLRIYGCHDKDKRKNFPSVNKILKKEILRGLQKIETYTNFEKKVDKIKYDLLSFLIKQKKIGKKVIAYGAAAKGNTLLNHAGIKKDLISCVFDAAKSKQNLFLPGSHLPILSPKQLSKYKPDYVLILPWNISKEIKSQKFFKSLENVKFITAVLIKYFMKNILLTGGTGLSAKKF